jgi:hypothetical protein
LAKRAGAALRAPGRGLGNGVREDRTRSYANIEPAIRAIIANTPARRIPTLSICRSIGGEEMWEDVM